MWEVRPPKEFSWGIELSENESLRAAPLLSSLHLMTGYLHFYVYQFFPEPEGGMRRLQAESWFCFSTPSLSFSGITWRLPPVDLNYAIVASPL